MHARVLAHTCSPTLFVRARVCAQDADFTVLRADGSVIRVSKAWALRRFILLFY